MRTLRLDSIAPLIAERFRRAPPDVRRRATLVAIEHAIAATGVSGSDVDAALEVLRSATPPPTNLRQRFETSAAEHDEEYIQLSETGQRETAALWAFSKARALAALAFALSNDELHEAIYEAMAAVDDTERLERSLATVLTP